MRAHLRKDNPIPQPTNHVRGNALSDICSSSLPPTLGHSIGKRWSRGRRYRLTDQEFGLVQVGGSLQSSVEVFDNCWNALWERSGAVLNQMRSLLPHEWCRVNEPWKPASRRCSRRRKLATSERVQLPQHRRGHWDSNRRVREKFGNTRPVCLFHL